MKRSCLVITAMFLGHSAFAQAPVARQSPDPNLQITLTYGELTQIILAEIAAANAQSTQVQAAGALAKLRQQIASPSQSQATDTHDQQGPVKHER